MGVLSGSVGEFSLDCWMDQVGCGVVGELVWVKLCIGSWMACSR